MKTKNVLLTTATGAILVGLTTSQALGYMGDGQGRGDMQGKGMGIELTTEQREEIQDMSIEERREYMQDLAKEKGIDTSNWKQARGGKDMMGSKNGSHDPKVMLESIPASDLSAEEKGILIYGYAEEMLARDLYNYFYELYGEQVFKNIGASEQHHMDAVEALLDRYDIDAPTGYEELESTYNELKAKGEKSLKDAIEVGIQVEILDIEDIEEAIKRTDNDDFKVVFTNIGGASYNHLRGFQKALDANNLETDIDYSEFLSSDDLDTKGSLSYKLAETLENEGVTLPEQVTSEALKNRQMGGKGGNMNYSNKSGDYNKGSMMRGGNMDQRNKYRDAIEEKYGSKISGLGTEKLNLVVTRIDDLMGKIRLSDSYTATKRQSYMSMLRALRDVITEKIGEDELDLDSLFE